MPLYWLDADVFIQSKNGLYSFELAPPFWKFIDSEVAKGRIRSSTMIYNEILSKEDPKDKLTVWITFGSPDDGAPGKSIGQMVIEKRGRGGQRLSRQSTGRKACATSGRADAAPKSGGRAEGRGATFKSGRKTKSPGIGWMRGALLFAPGKRATELIPAVTYVPTQLPVQYHRLSEA